MACFSRTFTRWLKLVLACVALAALSPSQAAASETTVVQTLGQVEGGSGRPIASRSRLRAAKYLPPAVRAPASLRASSRISASTGSRPRALRERAYLLNRALLR